MKIKTIIISLFFVSILVFVQDQLLSIAQAQSQANSNKAAINVTVRKSKGEDARNIRPKKRFDINKLEMPKSALRNISKVNKRALEDEFNKVKKQLLEAE